MSGIPNSSVYRTIIPNDTKDQNKTTITFDILEVNLSFLLSFEFWYKDDFL